MSMNMCVCVILRLCVCLCTRARLCLGTRPQVCACVSVRVPVCLGVFVSARACARKCQSSCAAVCVCVYVCVPGGRVRVCVAGHAGKRLPGRASRGGHASLQKEAKRHQGSLEPKTIRNRILVLKLISTLACLRMFVSQSSFLRFLKGRKNPRL